MTRRFFKHGELHLVVLALLARQSMHGYELMSELGRLFGPAYRPSPGSIYPAVAALESEGLIRANEADGRRVYSLTAGGQDALERRAHELGGLEIRCGVRIHGNSYLAGELARFSARVRAAEGRVEAAAVADLLDETALAIEQLAQKARPEEKETELP